ncbi:MAG TPA: outer membrane lipoprotein carrier protein LolA [Mesorhizobium sp.]|jgi:outer membrane lipoprotein-sorting protein|nr:outer membrane lipoprotein carrier protein LolA [Mesorhizobium sp.]
MFQNMTTMRFSPSRRGFLGLAASALLLAGLPGPAAAQEEVAAAIADHFSSIRTMTGDFIQFGPRGEQTGGKFYIQRPGKVHFQYESPSSYRVIADGKSVVVDNKKLKTADLYPLSKTPLKLLLDNRIDLSGSKVRSVSQDGDAVTIQLVDKSVFGNARIAMMFSAKDYSLIQWTITDDQGKDTTVMIDNVREGVKIDPSLFAIDYARIRELTTKKGMRN